MVIVSANLENNLVDLVVSKLVLYLEFGFWTLDWVLTLDLEFDDGFGIWIFYEMWKWLEFIERKMKTGIK